jgi:hypothetical protein
MTTEPMTDFEQRLTASLREYAEAATPVPYAEPVATSVSRRMPLLAAAAVALLMVVGVGALQLVSMSASRPAEVRVDGRTYAISMARSLSLGEDDVTAIGDVETSEGYLFADSTAYAVDGVDPNDALVARVAPGQVDGGGPYGAWVVLIRGEIRALCPYFDPASPATPAECRATTR